MDIEITIKKLEPGAVSKRTVEMSADEAGDIIRCLRQAVSSSMGHAGHLRDLADAIQAESR